MSEKKVTGVRVTYGREEFIRLAQASKKIAEKYCDDHPKEQYDDDDFNAVYYLQASVEYHQVIGSGRWSEEMVDRDRLIEDYNKFMYGE